MTDYNHNGLQNHRAQTNLYFRLSCFFITLMPKANEASVEKTQSITKSRNLFSDSPILDADGLFVGGGTSAAPKGREIARAGHGEGDCSIVCSLPTSTRTRTCCEKSICTEYQCIVFRADRPDT